MKNIVLLILLISVNLLQAQKVVKTSDNRFIGKNIPVSQAFERIDDPAGLIDKMYLGFEWWTLMGEPIEIYSTKWESTQHYSVPGTNGARQISRYELSKYPDLLKRFDNLQPIKMTIELSGSASGNVKLGDKYFNDNINLFGEQSPIFSKCFRYTIENHKLLLCKSDQVCNDIVAGSPKTWSEFILWDGSYIKPGGGCGSYISNQITDNKHLKHLFDLTKELSISARIKSIEWPEYEMNAIIDLYEKYEKGDLSPKQILEKEKEGKKKLYTDNNNDFWSVPDDVINDNNYEIKSKNGKYGVVNKETNKTLIPFNYDKILEYKNGVAIVKINDTKTESFDFEYCSDILVTFYTKGVVNADGSWLNPPERIANIGKPTVWSGYGGPVLTSWPSDMSYEERDRIRKKRKEEKRKKAEKKRKLREQELPQRNRKVAELSRSYKSQGYTVKIED